MSTALLQGQLQATFATGLDGATMVHSGQARYLGVGSEKRLPDHPDLLQRFLWQTLDLPPEFPRVHKFLLFWRREIQAVIHSVTVGGVELVAPARVRSANFVGRLN